MPTTPNMGFRYPALSDGPNGPQQIQDLATDVDLAVKTLKSQIGCRLTQGTSQSGWTSGSYTSITFGSEDFDWGTLHDLVTNTSRITIGGYLGLWEISGTYAAAQNANTTNHRARLTMNGAAVNGAVNSIGISYSGFVCIPLPTTFVLATSAGDYIEMQGLQTASTGTVGTAVASEIRSTFQAIYRGQQ